MKSLARVGNPNPRFVPVTTLAVIALALTTAGGRAHPFSPAEQVASFE